MHELLPSILGVIFDQGRDEDANSSLWSGMSGVTLPGNRPLGRALIVGTAPCRAQPLGVMQGLGYECAEVEDVYAAMVELCRRPLVYRSMILTLSSLFREELHLIPVVKKRFPHVDIYVTGIEGRQAALAEAVRLGADGLLADDGLHRTGGWGSDAQAMAPPPARSGQPMAGEAPVPGPSEPAPEDESSEPVLTAEELRALLEEHEPTTHGIDRD